MSLSEIIVKLIGLALAIVGFALLLSLVGLNVLGVSVLNPWVAAVLGVVFLGAGIYIIRGGTVSV
jgi:hypothetical protein